ncbi:MAG: hypothetical protein AAFO94_11930, partial [Bacteroidota bacterium]
RNYMTDQLSIPALLRKHFPALSERDILKIHVNSNAITWIFRISRSIWIHIAVKYKPGATKT